MPVGQHAYAVLTVPLLAAGVFLNGVSFAIGNVPLNVESAGVERRLGRTVIPQFHAAFSVGAVIVEVVGSPTTAAEGPSTLWGITYTVADIDATAAFFAEQGWTR